MNIVVRYGSKRYLYIIVKKLLAFNTYASINDGCGCKISMFFIDNKQELSDLRKRISGHTDYEIKQLMHSAVDYMLQNELDEVEIYLVKGELKIKHYKLQEVKLNNN